MVVNGESLMITNEKESIMDGARLFIFDFDGVIVDSEALHHAKFNEVLNEDGENISWDDYITKYLSLNDRDCFEAVLLDCGWRWAVESQTAGPAWKLISRDYISQLVERKSEKFERDLAANLKPVPGTLGFIKRASTRHPLAIASGALRTEIEEFLALHEIRDYFGAIVGADDVKRGKPYPDPFLMALELTNKLNGSDIQPHECIVIEDSYLGVEAAKKAGMRCIALTTSYPAEKFAQADMVTDSLEGVQIPL